MVEELVRFRADLRPFWDQPLSKPAEVDLRLQLPDGDSPAGAHMHREASRVLQKAQDTIRESVLSRMRARRLRAGLRTLSSPSGGRPPWAGNAPAPLSNRERQVLGLIVDGKTSKQIAAELGISFKTVVTHRASIMSKMDVHESTSVVREAIRRGLV